MHNPMNILKITELFKRVAFFFNLKEKLSHITSGCSAAPENQEVVASPITTVCHSNFTF